MCVERLNVVFGAGKCKTVVASLFALRQDRYVQHCRGAMDL